MALLCKAKKLILNNIGSNILPINLDQAYNTYINKGYIFDSTLLENVKIFFDRPDDVSIAKDLITVKIPVGGYTDKDANTELLVDASLTYDYINKKNYKNNFNTLESDAVKKNNITYEEGKV